MFHEIKEVTMNKKRLSAMPEGTHVRLESLPDRMCIFNQKVFGGGMSLHLDPGEYTAIFTFTPKGETKQVMRGSSRFLVDCTEEEARVLRTSKPKMSRSMQTSDGTRWTCQAPGCGHQSTSPAAAIFHENERHLHITREDFIEDPVAALVVAEQGLEVIEDTQQAKAAQHADDTVMSSMRRKVRGSRKKAPSKR